MSTQIDIFDTVAQYRVVVYHRRGDTHKMVISESYLASWSELEDILKGWNYHETVLDVNIYTSKKIERKFMTVAPIEQ